MRVDIDGWLQEGPLLREYYAKFGDHIPAQLYEELDRLESRLEKAKQEVA